MSFDSILSACAKWFFHKVIGTRRYYHQMLSRVAGGMRGKRILEIGSGLSVGGEYVYSAKHLFDASNQFICSDRNPTFGHKVLDVTTMREVAEYDVILCLNVLEHVFETGTALRNLHRALRENGIACIAVPVHYPLHEEPYDYWRFTEHGLRRLLKHFQSVEISHNGPRRFPFGYFVEAHK